MSVLMIRKSKLKILEFIPTEGSVCTEHLYKIIIILKEAILLTQTLTEW